MTQRVITGKMLVLAKNIVGIGQKILGRGRARLSRPIRNIWLGRCILKIVNASRKEEILLIFDIGVKGGE